MSTIHRKKAREALKLKELCPICHSVLLEKEGDPSNRVEIKLQNGDMLHMCASHIPCRDADFWMYEGIEDLEIDQQVCIDYGYCLMCNKVINLSKDDIVE